MITPSPVEIISIDIAESVIKKNLINLPKSRVTTSIATTTTISTTENTECIRDKFMDIIADNGNKISTTTPKSFYPGQARQIIATETGESQIFREVGSHDTGTSIHQSNSINDNEKNLDSFNNSNSLKCKIEDNTVSEKNIDVDGNISSSISNSETIRPDVVVAENETSQDDVGDSLRSASSIENEEKNIPLSVKIQKNTEISDEKLSVSHSISEITKETNNEFLNVNTDKQTDRVRKFVVDLNSQCNELDGKYRKSIVKSRKSPKHGNNLSEQVVPKMREAKNSSKQNIKNKDAKNLDVILLKNELTRKNYLGSLESINAKKPTALSKKSKSFEFIKTDFSLKEIDINYDVDTLNSSEKMSNSAIVTDETKNISCDNEVIDELCSVCCYGKNESSTKKMYTVHSNNSSPLELDTTECELCSSRNIPDSKTAPGEPQCELCEICGDIAMDMDVIASSRPETDELINARILAGSRHLPLSVAKQKISAGRLRMDEKIFDITDEDVDGEDADDESRQPSFRGERLPSTSVEEYSADDSTLDDVEFEIENCGLEIEGNQSLKKTVSATPEAIDKIKIEELDIIKEGSESKLMIRGTSLISRNTSKPDSRRRYSSVDNLPNSKQKVGSKSNESPCKLSVKTQNKVTQSIDNDRVSRITKNPNNIRKSMDNVAGTSQDVNKCQGKHESQLSNEQIDVTNEQQKDEHRIGPDTVRFIIGKHGLKIISDRETSL